MYDKKIFIYHSDQGNGVHFDTITKVNAMMCKSHYCDKCDVCTQLHLQSIA